MGEWTKARIQLCGRFVVDIDGTRIEDALPGRRGRALFAYLVLNRSRQLPRDELLMAGWGQDAPAEAGNALSVLLSKLRHGLGANHLRGRTAIQLLLPPATFVDVEAALEGAHRAESAIAEGRLVQAWGPAGRAGVLCRRQPRPWRPGAGPGRGTGQVADRTRALPRERAPPAHGGARAARERRRSAPRLRAATRPAPGGAGDRAQPHRAGRSPTAAAERRQLELLSLCEEVFAGHVADQLGVQDAHVALRVPPELVVIVALNDIPARTDKPQRHRQPPGHSAAIFTRGSSRA